MKNTFGQALTVTLFGESHGEMIGAVLDGLAPGIDIDHAYLEDKLEKRRPFGKISTARVEKDHYRIVSGVFNGKTCGTPLCLLIPNETQKSTDYSRIARPGHADYTAHVKYHGFEDYRGGGHFSGRLTAALVAVGAIVQKALEQKGIVIGSHIASLHGIHDRLFGDLPSDLAALSSLRFAVLDESRSEAMQKAIENAAEEGNSLGGILETAVIGLPAGLGEPWFDSFESLLAHALFSLGGVKGVSFGDGFAFAEKKGSEANDALRLENGNVITLTNHNGGLNGGITNGMPVLFKTCVKPTPSIFQTQPSVDIETMQETDLSLKGRHDPCILHRVRAVVDALTALVIGDLLTLSYGSDALGAKVTV